MYVCMFMYVHMLYTYVWLSKKSPQTVFRSDCTFPSTPPRRAELPALLPRQHLVWPAFGLPAILTDAQLYPVCLRLHFPMTKDVGHPVMYLGAIHVSALVKYPLSIF